MTDNARTVLREALALPPDDRAQIAAHLIASLDEEREGGDEVATAWAEDEFRSRRFAT